MLILNIVDRFSNRKNNYEFHFANTLSSYITTRLSNLLGDDDWMDACTIKSIIITTEPNDEHIERTVSPYQRARHRTI